MLDRGYLDFGRLYALHQSQAFFVTRAKRNTQFQRRYSRTVDRANTTVLCDQTGMLTVYKSRQEYPVPLRRVVITDKDGKRLTFLTNNFALTPELIAALYRQRWQVELFFKWIKQHLRIKRFLGTSENAVKTQIWIAIGTYVLIAIAKKHLQLERHKLVRNSTDLEFDPVRASPDPATTYATAPQFRLGFRADSARSPLKNVGTLLIPDMPAQHAALRLARACGLLRAPAIAN